jgi:hypothetical protein
VIQVGALALVMARSFPKHLPVVSQECTQARLTGFSATLLGWALRTGATGFTRELRLYGILAKHTPENYLPGAPALCMLSFMLGYRSNVTGGV